MSRKDASRRDDPIGDDELDGLFGHLAGGPLALAVSGGADSTALMHLVARWASCDDVKARWAEHWSGLMTPEIDPRLLPAHIDWRGLTAPNWLRSIRTAEDLAIPGALPQVVVLTVDHGLRAESAGEADFVAAEAAKLGLACERLRWDGEKPATGIQAAARTARRDLILDCLRAEAGFLYDLAKQKPLSLWRHLPSFRSILMAHHQEDQAETVLMRLARGSGLEGLAGMRPIDTMTRDPTPERPSRYFTHLRRPLLSLPKRRLIATLEAGGHGWLDDPSNEDHRFERVRIRKALATLGEVGLTAEMIALSARRLADADDSFRLLPDQLWRAAREPFSCKLFTERWLGDPEFATRYLAGRTLRQIIKAHGGAAREPELAQIEALVEAIWTDAARAQLTGVTLGGCKIELVGERHDRIRVYREGSGDGLPVVPLVAGDRFEWDGGRFTVHAQSWVKPGDSLAALGLAGWAALKKTVPELATLGWPAAAVATLPAVVRDGSVVDVPSLSGLIRQLGGDAHPASAAWRSHMAKLETGVITL